MRRTTLIDIGVMVVVVVLLAILVHPLVFRSLGRGSGVARCANNLKQLWTMQSNYVVLYGGERKIMPPETGSDFWPALSRTPTPLIDATERYLYFCPLRRPESREGCDYRGPRSNVNLYGDGDPVGADVEGNHGPGEWINVLRKSGDVSSYGPKDEMWARAAAMTCGGNPAP